MEKAVTYLAPYVLNPGRWGRKQIQPYQGDHAFFLALAGVGLNSEDYISSYKKIRKLDSSWPLLIEMILNTSR